MARPRLIDDSALRMALVGYEIERQKITDKIAEVQRQLGVRNGASASSDGQQPQRKRRKISEAGKRRIAMAQKKRWAALKAKAAKG